MDNHALNRIQTRWKAEKKVAAKDIDWMLNELNRISLKDAADSLKKKKADPLSDLFGDLFGRKP